MEKHLVFVYGTLRRGGVRAMPDIFPGSKFVGGASVSGSLYDFGEYPGLQLCETDSKVMGEVYEVCEDVLKRLDEIEAPAFYFRRQIEISLGDRRVQCWVYEPDLELYPERVLITSGDWIEHAGTKTERPGETQS